jgi:glycosyltransferase involved in cell wall biosynthesis
VTRAGHVIDSAPGIPAHSAALPIRPPVTDCVPVRPRILVIGALPPPYFGGSVVTQTLLDSALHERYELLHLDTTDRRGVENIGRLDAGNVWLAAVHGSRCAGILRRERVDMIYMPVAQNPLGFMRDALFLTQAALRGIPLVLHFHSANFAEFARTAPGPLRALIRRLVGRAERAIVLGSSFRHMLDGIVPPDRVAVVPNGVRDVPQGGRRERPRDGALRVLFLGNLIPGKGYVELIRAAGMLAAEGLDIEVVLAGAVMDPAVHRQAIHDSTVRITATGAVDAAAKQELLRTADVLALPSYYENEAHPLVILEAMAAGLPVVSTRYVAIPEMIADGETGILVQPRDVAGLADALRRLALDPALRDRMGRAGRARYLAEFTVPQWVSRMTDVFDSVHEKHAR